jgi:hypothetical protein
MILVGSVGVTDGNSLALKDGVITVFLDESMTSSESTRCSAGARRTLVGGVFTSKAFTLSSELGSLWDQLSESHQIQQARGGRKLRKWGFHRTEDLLEVKNLYMHKIAGLHGYRAFVCFSNHERLPNISEDQRALVLYRSLIPDVLLAAGNQPIRLIFEERPGMGELFKAVVAQSVVDAQRKSNDWYSAIPEVHIAKKVDSHLLSLIDYVLGSVGDWLNTDGKHSETWESRDMSRIEQNVSMIANFDSGLRSVRDNRDFH